MTDVLLLIHGFPLDGSMWDLQVQALSGPIQVLQPSLPGLGGAPGGGAVMTMDAAAKRCLAALDEAGADRAVVCGLSMGGYVAFELWRQAPGRFRGRWGLLIPDSESRIAPWVGDFGSPVGQVGRAG